MKEAQELKHLLTGYTGTDGYHRHPLARRFVYTDGVKAFAENAGNGAYWLLDILATQPEIIERARSHGFVIVVLDVRDGSATLTACDDISGDELEGVCYTRGINFTDCPEGVWKFYILGGQGDEGRDFIALLPSEY